MPSSSCTLLPAVIVTGEFVPVPSSVQVPEVTWITPPPEVVSVPPAMVTPSRRSTCVPAPIAAIVPPAFSMVMVAACVAPSSTSPPVPVASKRPALVKVGRSTVRPLRVPVASMTPFASLVSGWKLLAIAPPPEIVLSTLSSDAELSMKMVLLAESDSVTWPPPVSDTGLGVPCRPMIRRVSVLAVFKAIVPALAIGPSILKKPPAIAKLAPIAVLSMPRSPPPAPTLSEPPPMLSVTCSPAPIELTPSIPL